jgi:hypothetical protein
MVAERPGIMTSLAYHQVSHLAIERRSAMMTAGMIVGKAGGCALSWFSCRYLPVDTVAPASGYGFQKRMAGAVPLVPCMAVTSRLCPYQDTDK